MVNKMGIGNSPPPRRAGKKSLFEIVKDAWIHFRNIAWCEMKIICSLVPK